jgi:hypothetical protein
MKLNVRLLLVGFGLACAPAFASLNFCTTAACLGSNDSTSWGQLGGDTTPLTNFGATSALSVAVTGHFGTDNTGVVADVCPVGAGTCSWSPASGGILAGDSLVWAFDSAADGGNGAGTGPLTLAFGTSLIGAGAWIQAGGTGAFTATIQAFGAAGSLGAAQTETSATGDAIFLGLVNVGPATANITSIVFNVTSCATCSDPALPDFAIDTALMTDQVTVGSVPEPSTNVLLGSGLIGMAWMLRKRGWKNGHRS